MRRPIGIAGIDVNAIGLGSMPLSIQGRPEPAVAFSVIEAFVENGGDFIDTANSYCLYDSDFGHCERLIARSLARLGRGGDVLVATKGGLRRPQGRWQVDARPQWLRESCEQSLRDLDTDAITLHQLHAVDSNVPFADSLGELIRLKDEGKIIHIGLSNVAEPHLDEALAMTPIATVQNRCNVYAPRDFDNGLAGRCAREGVTYIAYGPVGGHNGHQRVPNDPTLARLAQKHESSPFAIALAWLLGKGDHVLPIPGASKVSSIRDSLTAVGIELDDEDIAAIDAAA